MQLQVQEHHYQEEVLDRWHYLWGNGIYSSKRLSNLAYSILQAPAPFIWLWKSKCRPRLKFFMWLVLLDRLNTRDLLRRKQHPQFQDNNSCVCVLCGVSQAETRDHLFFSCSFSKNYWNKLHIHWTEHLLIMPRIEEARRNFGHGFFMEIFIIATWEIWNQRNAKKINRERPSTRELDFKIQGSNTFAFP